MGVLEAQYYVLHKYIDIETNSQTFTSDKQKVTVESFSCMPMLHNIYLYLSV